MFTLLCGDSRGVQKCCFFSPFEMSLTVAITGGIACGKSVFSGFLTEAGCEVLDADDIVRQLQAPGGAALAPIREAFGDAVFDAEGRLDRAALAAVVFADPSARRKLEAIMHPLVRDVFAAWRAKPSKRLRVAVIPLLFETGGISEVVFKDFQQKAGSIRRMLITSINTAKGKQD